MWLTAQFSVSRLDSQTPSRRCDAAGGGNRGESFALTGTGRSMPGGTRARIAQIAAMVVLVALDLALKSLAARELAAGESVDLKLIQLRVTFNSGVAFGLGSGLPTGLLLVASGFIILVVAVAAWQSAPTAPALERMAMAAVIAGGIGNLTDRAVDGVVTDYLHTGWFPTFNLADVFITLGVGALFVSSLRPTSKPKGGKRSSEGGCRSTANGRSWSRSMRNTSRRHLAVCERLPECGPRPGSATGYIQCRDPGSLGGAPAVEHDLDL